MHDSVVFGEGPAGLSGARPELGEGCETGGPELVPKTRWDVGEGEPSLSALAL